MSKSVVRSVKNVTKGYSSVQVKVRNATSNDAWGPSGTDMSEIAQMTYNNTSDFYEIMDMLDKRLNDKGKNWRHVLKSLKVLDYCLHEGSELVVTWARKNIYIIKTLREFQYIDEEGRDVGLNVRHSAKELTSLILDEERLRAERHDRKLWKSRVTGLDDMMGGLSGYGNGLEDNSSARNRPSERRRPQGEDEDDLEYRLAIEASKNQEEEDRKRRQLGTGDGNDEDLAKALKLSKEEEELRRKQLEDQNAASLFDDTPAQPQATGWNQGYQQQTAVDWFGNPMEQQQQQQPQSTGFLNNAYAQQPQQTGFQNGYGYNPYQQQQPTGFDQSQFQQSYMQPQQTAFNMSNPYTQNGFSQQQQQPVQQQDTLQPGSKNPWAAGADPWENLKPQATGSNNPFAARPQSQPSKPRQTLNTLAEERAQMQYNQQPTMSFQAQQTAQPQRDQNPQHAHLNALLASREGQDTFGNTGDLRIPAQHTAPGTFVNSAGAGLNRLNVNQTGNNPFLHGQFTGMPQQSIPPAQTGPVGAYGGFPSSNPYGGQQRQQQQGGSLIDL